MSDEKEDISFFKDEKIKGVVYDDFKINDLSDSAKSLLKEYFIFHMKKLGYLAMVVDHMAFSESSPSNIIGGLFLSKDLPIEVVDSWVNLQLGRNKIIYLEKGISIDEFKKTMSKSFETGVSVGALMVKLILNSVEGEKND